MHVSIERAAFARLLTNVTRVVESRNTIPILNHVRLVADGDVLTATATDLDIEICAQAPCEGDSVSFCVDAKMLAGIVGKVSGDVVTIDVEATAGSSSANATVKCGKSRFRLYTLPVADFPDMSRGEYSTTFETDLAALFAPVQFAISTEETRYYLNGIFLSGADRKLVAVATDGHRLSRHAVDEPQDEPPLEFEGVIVPRKMVGLVPKGGITVNLSDKKIQFVSQDVTVTSKLIDGTFPDYQRVIPTGNDKIVTFGSADMKAAAGRVAIVSTERGKGVKLAFSDGQAVLTVNNPETGNAAEDVIVSYSGEPIDIGFNSSYLAELMGIFPAGDIRLALHDTGSPALFTSDKAEGMLAVLMPMRVA